LPITGYKENRGFSLIDSDKAVLEKRMNRYYDSEISWEELVLIEKTGLTKNAGRFDAKKARAKVLKVEKYDPQRIMEYLLRPYELRRCYYSPVRPLWNEPRPSLFQHRFHGNSFLIGRPSAVSDPEGVPFYFTNYLADFDSIRGHAYNFPIRLCVQSVNNNKQPKEQAHLIQPDATKAIANLSQSARSYLSSFGITNPDIDAHTAGLIWMHTLAIGYSPAYLSENADGIRKDWPRIPLPENKELLEASAELGEKIAALLDTEKPVPGLTASTLRPEMQSIAIITREGGGQLQQKELAVTVGWGHAGQNGVVMPGKGKAVERDYTAEEKQSIVSGAEKQGIPAQKALELLGERTFDIYLNDVAYWNNIPTRVWEYIIGGYQVIKKWLSYRETKLLGRPLSSDEAREVMNVARHIVAILLLQPALDENYYQCKANTYKW
jgi:hypothetical protein